MNISMSTPMSTPVNTTMSNPARPACAVVFAYHSVGVHAIKVLLARGLHIALVVTHQDNPQETIWFESVFQLCQQHGIACITPEQGNAPDLYAQVAQIAPDFIFSFYYRHMLPMPLLALARQGAYNLHGSLLPKYRGRVPVNWAVLHGESETGVTLHQMTAKPDAGDIIDQISVPILPDDTAFEVFGKLTVATEQVLWRSIPALMAGTASRRKNDLTQGSYFGGRKPEDGRIDWSQSAQQVYNLYRAVAPPYPGAFTNLGNQTVVLARARLLSGSASAPWLAACQGLPPGLVILADAVLGLCGDGGLLQITELHHNHQILSMAQCLALAEGLPNPPPNPLATPSLN
jgi:methionyl-tRNA formyltransferase